MDESSPANDALVLYYPLSGAARSVTLGAPSRDLRAPAVLDDFSLASPARDHRVARQ